MSYKKQISNEQKNEQGSEQACSSLSSPSFTVQPLMNDNALSIPSAENKAEGDQCIFKPDARSSTSEPSSSPSLTQDVQTQSHYDQSPRIATGGAHDRDEGFQGERELRSSSNLGRSPNHESVCLLRGESGQDLLRYPDLHRPLLPRLFYTNWQDICILLIERPPHLLESLTKFEEDVRERGITVHSEWMEVDGLKEFAESVGGIKYPIAWLVDYRNNHPQYWESMNLLFPYVFVFVANDSCVYEYDDDAEGNLIGPVGGLGGYGKIAGAAWTPPSS